MRPLGISRFTFVGFLAWTDVVVHLNYYVAKAQDQTLFD